MSDTTATGRGSTGNVIAAVCSFFIPGLGQLVQGRLLWALLWFIAACGMAVLTFIFTLGMAPFGWGLVSLFSCVHAALYKPAA